MKKCFLMTALTFNAVVLCAQDVVKPVLNVEGFKYTSQFSEAEAFLVRKNVINSIQATDRVLVVDLMNQNALNYESERRKSEAAMNDNRDMADMAQLNANYILTGSLNTIQTTSEVLTDAVTNKQYTLWRTVFRYTLSLINPVTGATEKSYDYTSKESSREGAKQSREAAIHGSLGNMSSFVEDAFAARGKILQVASGDDNKAKTVYINLGSSHGIKKGQKFLIYAVIDVAGAKSEKEIGDLTAHEVLGENRTLCKVSSGASDVAKYMKENVELVIKSREKKGLFKAIGNLL